MYHYCAKLFESAGAPRWAQRTGIEWMKGEPPMNTPGKASLPVIKRLPKYYRFLRTLKNDGITSISSRELAAQMGTTASQVRQDFNCIGDVNGRQGIGYSVENLLSILENLLFGNGDRLPTILIGCGRLGKAVSRFITTDTPQRCRRAERPSGQPGHQRLLELLPLRPVRPVSGSRGRERPPGRQPDEPGLPPAQSGLRRISYYKAIARFQPLRHRCAMPPLLMRRGLGIA